MKLAGTGIGQTALQSPFALMMKSYKQTVGAGIGTKRPAWLSNSLSGVVDTTRKRRFDNQALGETPQRSGPFEAGAEVVAKQLPVRPIQRKSAVAQKRKDRNRT